MKVVQLAIDSRQKIYTSTEKILKMNTYHIVLACRDPPTLIALIETVRKRTSKALHLQCGRVNFLPLLRDCRLKTGNQ